MKSDLLQIDISVENDLDQEVLSGAIERQEAINSLVCENIATAQKQYQMPKPAKQACFQVGDKVLRKNVHNQQRKCGKLDKNWIGPFTIVAIGKNSADLHSDNQFLPKVNIDHLRSFKTPQPIIPHNLKSKKGQSLTASAPPTGQAAAPASGSAAVTASVSGNIEKCMLQNI